jgi:hypothetical protein
MGEASSTTAVRLSRRLMPVCFPVMSGRREKAKRREQTSSPGTPRRAAQYAWEPGHSREPFRRLLRAVQRGEVDLILAFDAWVLVGDGDPDGGIGELLDLLDDKKVEVILAQKDGFDLSVAENREVVRDLLAARSGQTLTVTGQGIFSFCAERLAGLLQIAGVSAKLRARIVENVRTRARAFLALTPRERQVVVAPFLEEAAFHYPTTVDAFARAAATVVVRNGLLEEAHPEIGQSRMWWFSTMATVPLAWSLEHETAEPPTASPFDGLETEFPLAFSVCEALTALGTEGGEAKVEARGMGSVEGRDRHLLRG